MLLNNYTQATTSVTAVGATTIAVPLTPSVAPSVTDYLTLTFYDADGNIEIVQCTGISGSTLTVIRGAEGTTAREWPMGSTLASRATAAVLKALGNATGVLTSIDALVAADTVTVTGTNVGTLLEVGDAVGSTTVASVDSANQVTLVAPETAGSITVTKTPSNGDRVTSLNGVIVWS